MKEYLIGCFLLLTGLSITAQTTETGLAAYYADYLQGKTTALGETYDRNALTCAHRFHPKGTMLRVTNLANQKSVDVRVNDRGPYKDEYVVDLSLAAANAIDLTLTGTAKVLVEPIGYSSEVNTAAPTPKTTAAASTFQSRSPNKQATAAPDTYSAYSPGFDPTEVRTIPAGQQGYVVQLNAYSDYQNAANQIISIQRMGVESLYILEAPQPDRTLYKVVVGMFNDRNAAEQFGRKLKNEYQLNGIVVRLK